MGNTDKFEMIANSYDTSERIQIAKVSSNSFRSAEIKNRANRLIMLRHMKL